MTAVESASCHRPNNWQQISRSAATARSLVVFPCSPRIGTWSMSDIARRVTGNHIDIQSGTPTELQSTRPAPYNEGI